MLDDHQLLRRYADHGSEAAFGELVARYVNLVYSTALRRTGGDAHQAQDVAQIVFTDLARKAPSISEDVVLAGWLHRATQYAASQLRRSEQRRHAREQEAMNALNPDPPTDWQQIRPLLDEALDQLGQTDRDALLLRFFEQHSLAEVGRALGSNEDAARKRIGRALDKLRTCLIRRGFTTTAAALSIAISANAVQAAPAGLTAILSSASLAAGAGGTGTSLTILKFMTATKLKTGIIGALVVAGVITPLAIQQKAQSRLRDENAALRQQVAQLRTQNEMLSVRNAGNRGFAPHLPAPRLASTASAAMEDPQSTTNLYARFKDSAPKLTAAQTEAYLKENGRTAASLLAAFRCSGDVSFLEEAKQKFPNDPQVAFEAAFRTNAPPEERRQWLEAFKQSAPDNPLPNYISAIDYIKAGQTDQAVRELVAATGKKQFEDYTSDRAQNNEEAYLAAGYSIAEAKTISSMQLLLPQLKEMKQLCLSSVDLANSYRQAGDEASAQSLLQMMQRMGEQFDGSKGKNGLPLITELVGMAVQSIALKAMDPASPYGDGQTVKDRLDELNQRNTKIREFDNQLEEILSRMSDRDYVVYKDRWQRLGEESAMNWAVEKYGSK